MHFSNPECAYMPPVSWNLIFNMRNSGMRQGGKDRCRLLRGRESYLKEGEVELPSPPALSEAGGGTGADWVEGTQILRKIPSQTIISTGQWRVLLCFPQCTKPWHVRPAEAPEGSWMNVGVIQMMPRQQTGVHAKEKEQPEKRLGVKNITAESGKRNTCAEKSKSWSIPERQLEELSNNIAKDKIIGNWRN